MMKVQLLTVAGGDGFLLYGQRCIIGQNSRSAISSPDIGMKRLCAAYYFIIPCWHVLLSGGRWKFGCQIFW